MSYTISKTPIHYKLGDGSVETNYHDVNNKIVLGADITQDMITLEIIGNDLYIKFNSSDQLKLTGYVAPESSNRTNNIEILFNDNSVLSDISNIPVSIYGTTGNDTLSSALNSGFTNKTIYGGEGNDVITGKGTIDGGDGNDRISAVGTIIGGKGNDKIVLTGGAGGSNIIYNLGDGVDTVEGFYNTSDKITLGAGITPDDVSFRIVAGDLFILIKGDVSIKMMGYILKNNYGEYPELAFADGTVWSSNIINNSTNFLVDGHLVAGQYVNNKVLYENYSNTNHIVLSQDNRQGKATDNIIRLGNGNDQITDYFGYNEIYAGGGNDTIFGVGLISGGKGDDIIYLGGIGLAGSKILFELGDGKDIVNNSTSSDKIVLGTGITPDMVKLIASGKDLIIKINDQDQITLTSYFNSKTPYGWLDTIEFANGIVWEGLTNRPIYLYGSTLVDNINKTGNYDAIIDTGDGNDIISTSGYLGNNTIYAGKGNDNITALTGDNNYLDGGAGDDTIIGRGTFHGGTGNDLIIATQNGSADTFLFNLGDGQDTINSYDTSLTTDRIIFGDNITASMISFARDGDNLIVLIGNGGDQIVINHYYLNESYQTINRFEFNDGTVWTDIASKVPASNTQGALFDNSEPLSLTNSPTAESQLSNLINAMASFAPESSSSSIAQDTANEQNSLILAVSPV